MTTILGYNIRLIRPSLPHKCNIYKDELPVAKYQSRTKTIKEHCGKVVEVCVKLTNGAIRSMPVPSTHHKVCEILVEDLNNVSQVGWKLENGQYLWR